MVEEKNTNIQGNGEPTFAEAFEQSLVTLNTGQIVTGTIISITPTEVYVDLGYKADGIIPADELSEDPSANPADVVKVGDEVEVFVVRVNDGEGYVKLSKKKIDAIKGWQTLELDGKRIIKCRPGKARGERTMQQFCYYCLGTVSGRKIGHKASWTGRTPTWCPRGRDK